MKKIVKNITLTLILLTAIRSLSWAIADPFVNGANVSPAPITTPTGITVSFQVLNNGTSTSSPAVTLTVSLLQLAPAADFNPATDITGTGAAYFTWTYNSDANMFTGVLNQSFPQFGGGPVVISNIVSTGLSSPGSEANGLNVNVVAPGAVNSSTANDNTNAYTSSDAALPVRLVSFEAGKEGTQALLSWATTEEVNSEYFEVQHSVNAGNWTALGRITSRGDSKIRNDYRYVHAAPASGLNYYRLKMVDRDGTFEYSIIRSVGIESGATMSVYPNPVSETFYLKDIDPATVKSLRLYNTAGLQVFNRGAISPRGIDVSHLPAGLYLLSVSKNDGSVETRKVMIKR